MNIFKKFFNAVNNSPFSYVAKKDKRQVITLIVIIFAALFLTKVSQKVAAGKIRNLLAVYAKNEDLINIGAYTKGSDPNIDKAIAYIDKINSYLMQKTSDSADFEVTRNELIKLANLI